MFGAFKKNVKFGFLKKKSELIKNLIKKKGKKRNFETNLQCKGVSPVIGLLAIISIWDISTSLRTRSKWRKKKKVWEILNWIWKYFLKTIDTNLFCMTSTARSFLLYLVRWWVTHRRSLNQQSWVVQWDFLKVVKR